MVDKKDGWEKFSHISKFLSSIVVVLGGIYITGEYNEQQNLREIEIKKAEVLVKLIPHLSSEDSIKIETAILTLHALELDKEASVLAVLIDDKGATDALVALFKNNNYYQKHSVKVKLARIAESGLDEEKLAAYKVFNDYHWIIHAHQSADGGKGEWSGLTGLSPEIRSDKLSLSLMKLLVDEGISHTIWNGDSDDIPYLSRLSKVVSEKPRVILHINVIRYEEYEGDGIIVKSSDDSISITLGDYFSKRINKTSFDKVLDDGGIGCKYKKENIYLYPSKELNLLPEIELDIAFNHNISSNNEYYHTQASKIIDVIKNSEKIGIYNLVRKNKT